jgi:hypothetical protein
MPKQAHRPAKAAPTHTKNADLTPQKLRFVEWLFSEERTPKTQSALAAELGVDAATLSDWKRSDPIVTGALAKIESMFSLIDLAQFRIATNIKHQGATQAATFLAKRFGMFRAEKVELSGRMSLADFLAAGGYSREGEAEQRARVN